MFREFVAFKRRREDVHDQRISLAYETAALTRGGTKGMPKLESLLVSKRSKSKRKQSAIEQVAVWQAIAARFGGKFTPVDRRETSGR